MRGVGWSGGRWGGDRCVQGAVLGCLAVFQLTGNCRGEEKMVTLAVCTCTCVYTCMHSGSKINL